MAANTVISCSFLPSCPPPRLGLTRAQVSSCAPALERQSNCFSLKPVGVWSLVLIYWWIGDANALQMLPLQTAAVPEGAGGTGRRGWLPHLNCTGPDPHSDCKQVWLREEAAPGWPKLNITMSNASTACKVVGSPIQGSLPFFYSFQLLLDSNSYQLRPSFHHSWRELSRCIHLNGFI